MKEEEAAGDPYESVDVDGTEALVLKENARELGRIDTVVFDCDGVLIDARQSYDKTIVHVVEAMVGEILGVALPGNTVVPPLTARLRRTGGFNNDWDSTYALTLLSLISMPDRVLENVRPKEGRRGMVRLQQAESAKTIQRLRRTVDEFASSKPRPGYGGLDDFLEGQRLAAIQRVVVRKARAWLSYPGQPPESRMVTMFDEVYCGGELFREMYGAEPRYNPREGLIERERVLVGAGDLQRLTKILGGRRLAIASGRPHMAAEYTLGELLDYFDIGASIFLGDGDLPDSSPSRFEAFLKPSGESIIHARSRFGSSTLLYVGDSAEDRLMARDAKRRGVSVLFAGVGQDGPHDAKKQYFKEERSDLVLENVKQLPTLLEMLRG